MNESELKTSKKQRFWISVIAIIMVGSFIASYAAIIIAGGTSGSGTGSETLSSERISYYSDKYYKKQAEFETETKNDFAKFSTYLPEIKAYNETSANENGIQSRDLLVGTGREITDGDTNYLAYYVGWCADETIFDSSFNSTESPSAFSKVLDVSLGMIDGWNTGMIGARIGGVREMTISSEYAYKDQLEICGGVNKPLKFIVMPVANEEPLKTLAAELDAAYQMYEMAAYYGIDYEKEMEAETELESTENAE